MLRLVPSIIVVVCMPAFFERVVAADTDADTTRPNIVLILCDNLGYGDIGCFGSELHRTPQVDRLAREGRRFTSFYVSSGVCTPSRASLMTGCYPQRVNMHISDTNGSVLRPVSKKGLHPSEVTMAEVLKDAGYRTAIIGKWHLGDQRVFLPTRHGFDYYFGIPYSDDMTPRKQFPAWPPLPLLENETVIEAGVDRNLLTKRTTEKAVAFIRAHRDEPFFLYFPQTMPGSTSAPFASEAFRGKSKNGPYGDSVEEIDWSTGQIIKTLEELGLDERTLIIWTSDNGAPERNPPQGRNTPLGGWGYSTTEGGMRVPMVVRWPGRIEPGSETDEIASTMDLLPTFAKLTGAKLSADRTIDGKDISSLLLGVAGAKSPHEVYYFYHMAQLQAVRSGKWKLHLPLKLSPLGRTLKPPKPLALYDLETDIGETANVSLQHPEVVQRLLDLAEEARSELGDTMRRGRGQRAAGWVEDPMPLVLSRSVAANVSELEALIQQAGNAASDEARLVVLGDLLKLPKIPRELQQEAQRLVKEIRRYLTDNDLAYFGQSILDTNDYDFGVAADSPLYPLTDLYRGRMLIWTTLEYGGNWTKTETRRKRLELIRKIFDRAHRAYPEEPLAGMYLGDPMPPPSGYRAVNKAPAWAVAQREALERLTDIIHWWIDHRQRKSGQYGGGWGDDCEMWRWWVPVLLGFDDPKINAAQKRFSEALFRQEHMQGGYTSRLYDVEHTAEDSADAMTPMLHLHPDSKLWKQRAMRLVQLMNTLWAGKNQRGQLQFKSTYFSVDQVDTSAKRACDTVYHPRALQPALLLWQRNHDPALTRLFSAWMDTWVDAAARSERGKPAGVIPSAIHWPDGAIGGVGKNWWDPENHTHDPLYVFPSEMPQLTHTLLLTYYVTGDEKYLAPIRSMAAIRLRHPRQEQNSALVPGTEAWCAAKMGNLSSILSKYRLLTGSDEFDALLQRDASAYARFRFLGDDTPLLRALSNTAAALRINFAGYTSEVRYTDRVLRLPSLFAAGSHYVDAHGKIRVPDTDLLYATVTGDPGIASYFPLNAVRWLTEPRNLAALVTDSSTEHFAAKLFHFGSEPRRMAAKLYLLKPGHYNVMIGSENRTLKILGPRTRLEFTLPPQNETHLRIELMSD